MSFDEYLDPKAFLIGRSAALAEAAHRREKRAFKKLCHRLYLKRWRAKNRERVRELDRARRRRKRRAIVLVCRTCGRSFTPRRYRTAKSCSRKCRNTWNGARRKPRARGLRNMGLEGRIIGLLGAAPWLTLPSIVAALVGDKRGSIATKLCELAGKGALLRCGADGVVLEGVARGKKGVRYALAGAPAPSSGLTSG